MEPFALVVVPLTPEGTLPEKIPFPVLACGVQPEPDELCQRMEHATRTLYYAMVKGN